MTEERLHQFQIALYETGDEELRVIAARLGDPKYKEGLRKLLLEKKLYRILGLMIDPHSFELIKEANKNIDKIRNKLIVHGGWFSSRYGITALDAEEEIYQNHPGEFENGQRPYHLDRDENGYHTQDFEPEPNSLAFYIRQTEKEFLREREVELQILHQMYLIKERIMGGDYQINPKHADIANFICEYFGYGKQEELAKTK